MKFTLRPYQKETTQLLRQSIINGRAANNDFFRPIIALPTGGGKTVTFSALAESAQRKGNKILVVCHRKELITQARSTMEAYGVNPLMIEYGMVQTFVRSPHKIPKVDVCIIDECHIGNFKRFIELLPNSVQIIGATATPISASNKNPLNKIFSDVVCPVQIRELIKGGYLSTPTYHVWKIDETKLEKVAGEFSEQSQNSVFSLKDMKEAYSRKIGKTLIFCSSIVQSKKVFECIQSLDDKNVFLVHSKMKESKRDEIILEYKTTDNSVMVNCGILTAGFDEPIIRTTILFRATTSLALYLQMVGRGARIVEGVKDTFNIFDMGNNHKRLGAWEIDRNWEEIFKLQGKKLKDKEAPMKKCFNCDAIIFASSRKCPYCNEEQPIKKKSDMVADEIQIIASFSQLPNHLKIKYNEMTVRQLIERAQYGSPNIGRPYKTGWILMQLKERENFGALIQEFAEIKGYKAGWIRRQIDGY